MVCGRSHAPDARDTLMHMLGSVCETWRAGPSLRADNAAEIRAVVLLVLFNVAVGFVDRHDAHLRAPPWSEVMLDTREPMDPLAATTRDPVAGGAGVPGTEAV